MGILQHCPGGALEVVLAGGGSGEGEWPKGGHAGALSGWVWCNVRGKGHKIP